MTYEFVGDSTMARKVYNSLTELEPPAIAEEPPTGKLPPIRYERGHTTVEGQRILSNITLSQVITKYCI